LTFAFSFKLIPFFAYLPFQLFHSMCLKLSVNAPNTLAISSCFLRRLIFFSMSFRASPSFHTRATIPFLTTRQLCFSSRLVNISLAIQILPYSLVFVYWPGFSSPRVLVSRRRPHYFRSSQSPIPCCGSNTALSKLRTASSRSSQIPLASPSLRPKHSRCTSGYLPCPSL